MEQRLIDANALRERLLVLRCNITDVQCISDIFDICLTEVSNASTVETTKAEHKAYNEGFKDGVDQGIKLSERPKGEWEDMSWFYHNPMYKCTHCNHILEVGYYSYCPKCGADMRGDNNDS